MLQIDYMQTTLHRFTFINDRIRVWVEQLCGDFVLNLFAGEIPLKVNREIRNDLSDDANAEYHKDALQFIKEWNGDKFDTVVLDPPYSIRKSMEMYGGKISSPFNQIKDCLCRILKDNGNVITLGYHSVSMGKIRGFNQENILLMSHGGAIHDTIIVNERRTLEQYKTKNKSFSTEVLEIPFL